MEIKNVMSIFRKNNKRTKEEKIRTIIINIVKKGLKGEKRPKDLEPSLFFKVAKKETILNIIEKEFELISKYNLKKKNDSRISPAQLNNIKLLIDLLNDVFKEQREDLVVSYEETSLYQLHKVVCPICGKQMAFKKSKKFNIYYCENDSCDTIVSCHPHSALPAGLPADKETRKLRITLHWTTAKFFKSSKKNLYSFLSRMIEREFDDFHGHIGSMSKEECKKLLNLFCFLRQRSRHLNAIKGTKAYYSEENFISQATHKEMQAYYVYCEKGIDAYKNFASKELQQSMFEKGFLNKNMDLDSNKVKVFI